MACIQGVYSMYARHEFTVCMSKLAFVLCIDVLSGRDAAAVRFVSLLVALLGVALLCVTVR